MQPELSWTDQALRDVQDIYILIGLEQPSAAERFFDRIESKTLLLTFQPRMGISRSDIRPGLRMLVDAPYLILYRVTPDTDAEPVNLVEIVRVVDGRRELKSLF